MPPNGKPNGRFELPQFTPVNFSLTDGTDIPPPPASPVREEPPPRPVSTIRQVSENPITPTSSGTENGTANGYTNGGLHPTASMEGVYNGMERVNGASQTNISDSRPPMSPVSANRPNSIRRFLSRKSMNANYENGTNSNTSHEDLAAIERPESSLSFATGRPDKKNRPSWFRRLTSKNANRAVNKPAAGNRASVIYEDMKPQVMAPAAQPFPQRPKGPPAPKLPELNRMKAQMEDDQGSLGGGEMFKNIK